MPDEMCHCGQPLHYTDPRNERAVRRLIAVQGERMRVTVGGRTWLVPRHYIALHTLKGAEIASLGFEEITGKETK